MSLLGNYTVLHRSPAKFLTGTIGYGERSNWGKPGMILSRENDDLWAFDATPSGFYFGKAYYPPRQAGRISSAFTIRVDASGVGALARPGTVLGSFTVQALAVGGLIAGGVANASFTVTGAANIAGLAAGRTTSVLRINATAIAGASAFGVANSLVRVTGYLQPYALGYMKASTVDNTVLTAESISAKVWSALAAVNNTPGTMGARLNGAGSITPAEVWQYIIESGYSAQDMMKIFTAVLSNTSENNPSNTAFKSIDGTKTRVTAAVDLQGNRSSVIRDVS